MTSSSQEHSDIPEQLWFLCPRAHTIITFHRFTMPPEARPKLHYILTYTFHAWPCDEVLDPLLTSLSSKREEQGPANRDYTFSFRYTSLSWQAGAEICGSRVTDRQFASRVRSTLVQWKDFAENHQIEVLDGYEVDIRDVVIPSEVLDDSSRCT